MSEQSEKINLKESVICLLVSLLFLSLLFRFLFLLDLSFWLDIEELTDKEIISYFLHIFVIMIIFVFIFLKSISYFIREPIKISRWAVHKIKERRAI